MMSTERPKPIRKAIFPVAGLGTRFLPATKAIPKEMLPLVDKPLIEHAVDEARAAGIEEFIFVTSRGKTALEDHFDVNFELNATLEARGKQEQLDLVKRTEMPSNRMFYTRQKVPLGLGHAVWCARQIVGDEPVAVVLPDDVVLHQTPCLAQMVEAYNQIGGNIVAVLDVPRENTSKYGILDISSDNGKLVEVKGLVEKPKPDEAPSNVAIYGRYILQPQVFDHLSSHRRGAGGEIQLTDAIAAMIGEVPVHGFRFEGRRFDCGDKAGFITANLAFALQRPELVEQIRSVMKEYS
ncbi:UTP--glucose-1-phosphate uridylyltransferase GalU [Radicibacter daui]|uniref:UTP--glucose-1-phosphate uridylyltransferase GalU n=1 Tax=Radicibacter daui TaxID=3064829 RepID=UPI004046D524